jgi:hypothetical protein
MHSSNSFLKMPFALDGKQLQTDLEKCLELNWKDHFNPNDYSGDWKGIALRSASGNETDILSHPDSVYSDTQLLKSCPYFSEIIQQLKCDLETIRLLRLAPGSVINEHRDRGTGYSFGNFRLHIVIRTDSNVVFKVDGEILPMKEGECWYADFDKPHSVENKSGKDRIHLIIDCVRNDWSDKLFAEAGYDFTKENTGPDEATVSKMIEELERMDTETSRALIAQLKAGQNKNAQ